MIDDLVKRLRGEAESEYLDLMMLEAADRIEELQYLFDMRSNCDKRAIKQWQAAHPGNDRIWPNHADLCVWLMERVEELEEREKVI